MPPFAPIIQCVILLFPPSPDYRLEEGSQVTETEGGMKEDNQVGEWEGGLVCVEGNKKLDAL